MNALDHVDNVQRAATEMIRVLRPGGLLLLATELNHRARLTEPQTFGWEVLDLFSPPLVVLQETRLEDSGEGFDRSLADAVPYREDEPRHKGVLLAKLWAPTS